jgi:DNA polymerase-4
MEIEEEGDLANVILHCDMDNYFASVECIDKPQLVNRPVAVCGDPAMRHGIVLAKNDMAKKYGIITGESWYAAKSKCPELVVLPPNYPKYLKYAKLARGIYSRYSSRIFPYGMDEAWIDLADTYNDFEDGIRIADEIRQRIKDELSLTASVGVSFNYIFSKLASDMKKPDATSIIPFHNFKSTAWNLPAFDMLFVGSVTRKTLRSMGILTIGDLANYDPHLLVKKLGKKGWMLWEFANGNDSSFDPCTNDIKSLGNSITPPKDITSQEDAAAFLYVLSSIVSKRLKKHGFKSLCVSIVVRRSDFTLITRQKSFNHPTAEEDMIFGYAYELFTKNHTWERTVRSIGVRADKLSICENEQLSLLDCFEDPKKTNKNISELISEIKEKYGNFGLEQSASGRDAEISIME